MKPDDRPLETLGQPSPGQHKFSLKDASLEIFIKTLPTIIDFSSPSE